MSAAAGIVTGALSLFGVKQQDDGAAQQAAAQRQAAEYSAKIASARSASEAATAAENARRAADVRDRRMATLRAVAGGSGVGMSGSALDTLAASRGVLDTQVDEQFAQGMAGATAYQQQAGMSLYQGGLAASATQKARSGNLLSGIIQAGMAGYNAYRSF